VLVFLAAFTTALYHRVWEYLTPLEPPHGSTRLTGAKPATINSMDRYRLAVQLPDGRLWREFLVRTITNRFGIRSQSHFDPLTGNPFVPGSNWVTVVVNIAESVGIQSDGSLWVSEVPDKCTQKQFPWGLGWALVQPPARLVRYGDETNWQSVANLTTHSVLLLKADGTLWGWGTNRFNRTNEWPGLRAFQPHRLGTESNWAEIFQAGGNGTHLRKADGSVWFPYFFSNDPKREKNEIEPGLTFERVTGLGSASWQGTAWARLLPNGMSCRVGVRSDGTFRAWGPEQFYSELRNYERTATDLQIGGETNWLALAGWGGKIVTLKRDGSLWLWNFQVDRKLVLDPKRLERELRKKIPAQLGTHSDWVAIGNAPDGMVSLAVDGSLWHWQFADTSLYSIDGEPAWLTWLAPLRKPQMIGNIFSASLPAQ